MKFYSYSVDKRENLVYNKGRKKESRLNMKKISLHVDGMKCGMCESHVNDAVRKAADVKKYARRTYRV